jgi:hypothetical protein
MDEIEKITKEVPPQKEQHTEAEPVKAHKDTFSFAKTPSEGFVFTPEFGALFGVGQHTTNENYFDLKMVFAGLISHKTYIGAGFALDVLGKNSSIPIYEGYYRPLHALNVPLFLEVRHSFLQKRVSPFISQDAGYTFYLETPVSDIKDLIGGAMIETQVGAKIFISKKVAANVSLGYRFQQFILPGAEYYTYYGNNGYNYYYSNSNTKSTSVFYNYITLHFGFTF